SDVAAGGIQRNKTAGTQTIEGSETGRFGQGGREIVIASRQEKVIREFREGYGFSCWIGLAAISAISGLISDAKNFSHRVVDVESRAAVSAVPGDRGVVDPGGRGPAVDHQGRRRGAGFYPNHPDVHLERHDGPAWIIHFVA